MRTFPIRAFLIAAVFVPAWFAPATVNNLNFRLASDLLALGATDFLTKGNRMDKGMYVAVSGAIAAQKKLDATANNLANISTPGFKTDRLLFESYLNKHFREAPGHSTPASPDPSYMRHSEYVVANQLYTDFSQGPVRVTGNPLDLALKGDGFLAVMTSEGERYTRNGALQVGANGELVTGEGHVVLDELDRPLYVNDGMVTVDDKGNVWVAGDSLGNAGGAGRLPEGTFGRHAGRLKLVDFAKPYNLAKEGNGLIRANDPADALPAEDVEVLPEHLESSNVNMIREMTDMIEIQRTVETYQKAIRESEQMTTTLILQISRAR